MGTVIIRREKIYPTPGTNYRVAWTWRYVIECDGDSYAGTGIGWARRMAKRVANGAQCSKNGKRTKRRAT